jgi:dUTP pyrophosphatase
MHSLTKNKKKKAIMELLKYKFVSESLGESDKVILAPERKSNLASGFDLASAHQEQLTLYPGARLLVSTGIAIALQAGFEGHVRSRSGLALKFGVVVLNSPGTIDADYRGEIKVILANLSSEPFLISFGMRIAQLVITPVLMPMVMEVAHLDHSERGDKGFGSTG